MLTAMQVSASPAFGAVAPRFDGAGLDAADRQDAQEHGCATGGSGGNGTPSAYALKELLPDAAIPASIVLQLQQTPSQAGHSGRGAPTAQGSGPLANAQAPGRYPGDDPQPGSFCHVTAVLHLANSALEELLPDAAIPASIALQLRAKPQGQAAVQAAQATGQTIGSNPGDRDRTLTFADLSDHAYKPPEPDPTGQHAYQIKTINGVK